MPSELDMHLADVKLGFKKRDRDNVINSVVSALIGGGLGYWAFGTLPHGLLFFYITYAISVVGNRITYELYRIHSEQKAADIINRNLS
jgi:uncharacterized BrkB/YihY/UPF0761 family membrane protein